MFLEEAECCLFPHEDGCSQDGLRGEPWRWDSSESGVVTGLGTADTADTAWAGLHRARSSSGGACRDMQGYAGAARVGEDE